MATVTSPPILDDTGQSIATALDNIADALGGARGERATYEESPALYSHISGEYIYYNERFYKVIAPIAVGATLVVGTNITDQTGLKADTAMYIADLPGGSTPPEPQTAIIALSATTASLDNTTSTATITMTTNSDGTPSVSSSDSSVATASISNNTITITGHATGSATVTISIPATDNYTACSATISVTATFVDFFTDWLTAANLNPASYADLDAVLADESAVRKLFTIHDAVDVIVDEVSTIESTDLTKIFNNDYVAKWVNLRDYALDTLYANSTIAGYMDTADKYFYGEWVITDSTTTPVTWGPKGNVPVMTSDTTPYGEAFASSTHSGTAPWKVFDGNPTTRWWGVDNAPLTNLRLGYKFTNPVCVRRVSILSEFNPTTSKCKVYKFKVQGSDDGTTWTDVSDIITAASQGVNVAEFNNSNYYLQYCILILESGYSRQIANACDTNELQFYGREMKVSVPAMTSNTAPYGEAFASSTYSAADQWQAYGAFDGVTKQAGDNVRSWMSLTGETNPYIGYKFTKQTVVKKIFINLHTYAYPNSTIHCTLEGSNNGTDWSSVASYNLTNVPSTAAHTSTKYVIDVDNDTSYLYYRIKHQEVLCVSGTVYCGYYNLQFFGFDYSEDDIPTIKTFATATDAEIVAMVEASDKGIIDLYEDAGWRVGQERKVNLAAIASSGTYDGVSWSVGESNEAQEATLILLNKGGFNLVTPVLNKDGTQRNECSFVVGIKNALKTGGKMYSSNSTGNSRWDTCWRRDWCNGGFKQAIPSSIRGVFKQFVTPFYAGGWQSTNDYFTLLAQQEVVGTETAPYGNSNETRPQFTYFAQSTANRVKYPGDDGTESFNYWWLRTYSDNISMVLMMRQTAGQENFIAHGSGISTVGGISPIGCI